MIITNEKFEVSYVMLEKNNMTRGDQIGIPCNGSLIWKDLFDITESDYDVLEAYFMGKENT